MECVRTSGRMLTARSLQPVPSLVIFLPSPLPRNRRSTRRYCFLFFFSLYLFAAVFLLLWSLCSVSLSISQSLLLLPPRVFLSSSRDNGIDSSPVGTSYSVILAGETLSPRACHTLSKNESWQLSVSRSTGGQDRVFDTNAPWRLTRTPAKRKRSWLNALAPGTAKRQVKHDSINI